MAEEEEKTTKAHVYLSVWVYTCVLLLVCMILRVGGGSDSRLSLARRTGALALLTFLSSISLRVTDFVMCGF